MGRRKKAAYKSEGILVSRANWSKLLTKLATLAGSSDPPSSVANDYPVGSTQAAYELFSRGLQPSISDIQAFGKLHCRVCAGSLIWHPHDIDSLGEKLASEGKFNSMSAGLRANGFGQEDIVHRLMTSLAADPDGCRKDVADEFKRRLAESGAEQ